MPERFEVKDTPIAGVKLITRLPISDERGWLERSFCAREMTEAGWPGPVVQVNRTYTKDKATVRGMHYQNPPHAEMKFVSCLHGAVFDVAVDLRAGSPTFLQHVAAELSGDNRQSLLMPEGVAHGFQTLTDDVEMLYFHSAAYAPDHEDSVHPQDPALGINWPLAIKTLSDRDSTKDYLGDSFEGIKL